MNVDLSRDTSGDSLSSNFHSAMLAFSSAMALSWYLPFTNTRFFRLVSSTTSSRPSFCVPFSLSIALIAASMTPNCTKALASPGVFSLLVIRTLNGAPTDSSIFTTSSSVTDSGRFWKTMLALGSRLSYSAFKYTRIFFPKNFSPSMMFLARRASCGVRKFMNAKPLLTPVTMCRMTFKE